MKALGVLVCMSLVLCAMDEVDVKMQIELTRNVEQLSTHMQKAPHEHRHLYVEAIKALVAEENEAKRAVMAEALEQQKGAEKGNQGAGSGGRGNGGGSGGGKGGGGNGGGGGRK